MEAVAALMKAGEFETDIEYFLSRTSIDTLGDGNNAHFDILIHCIYYY